MNVNSWIQRPLVPDYSDLFATPNLIPVILRQAANNSHIGLTARASPRISSLGGRSQSGRWDRRLWWQLTRELRQADASFVEGQCEQGPGMLQRAASVTG